MKDLNYGAGYKYAHDYDNNFAFQEFLPSSLSNKIFYKPGNNEREHSVKKWLKLRWGNKYNF